MSSCLVRIVSVFMSILIAVTSFPYKVSAAYEGDIVDWLADVAVSNTLPAVGGYLLDSVKTTSDLVFGSDLEAKTKAFSSGLDNSKELLKTLGVDSGKLVHAVRNQYNNMSDKGKENIALLYEQNKDKSLVISPELNLQLKNDYDIDFNVFFDSILNKDIFNFGKSPYAVADNSDFDYDTQYINYFDLYNMAVNNEFWPYSSPPYDSSDNSVLSTFNSDLKKYLAIQSPLRKYLYTVQQKYIYNGSEIVTCHFFLADEDFYFLHSPYQVSGKSYEGLFVQYPNIVPSYMGLFGRQLDVLSGLVSSISLGDYTDSPDLVLLQCKYIKSPSSATSALSNLVYGVEINKYLIDYTNGGYGDVYIDYQVQNTVNNFYENIDNIYNSNEFKTYFPTEIYLCEQKTDNYYEYSTDLDFSRTINNYVENNTYQDGDVTYVTNITNIINNASEPTEPTDPTDPTDPIDPSEPSDPDKPSIFDKLKDLLGQIFDLGDWDFSIFEKLKELITFIIDSLKDFFLFLFVPDDGFIEGKVSSLYEAFLNKLPIETQLNMILSLSGSNTDSFSLSDYSLFAPDERTEFIQTYSISSFSSSPQFDDITVELMGTELVLVDSTYINLYLPQIRTWIRGVLSLILIAFNLNQFYAIVKGSPIFNPSGAMPDISTVFRSGNK